MSVFSDLKPTNHAPRNGFDLGRFSTFSTKAGYITTVFSQATLPSAEYSLDIKQLLRTQPLQKAAFTGFSINYDVIWSPYNHLYSSFNQFIAQRSNKNIVNQPTHQTIPTFNLGIFFRYVFTCALQDYMMSFCEDESVTWQNQSRVIQNDHMPHESVALNVLRHLDMMNYGNLLPLLKNTYRAICDMDLTYTAEGADPVTIHLDPTKWKLNAEEGKINVFDFLIHYVKLGIDNRTGYNNDSFADVHTYWMRFLDGLNTGVYTNSAVYPLGGGVSVGDELDSFNTSQCNLFAPLAYNKAFYEYYRNTYFDDKYQLILATDHSNESNRINSFDYVQLFNLDDNPELGHYEGSTQVPADFHQLMRLFAIFDVKPHLYKRDLFTGVLPSTQFGDVSVMVTDDLFRALIGNVNNASTSQDNLQLYTASGANYNTIRQNQTAGSVSSISDKFRFDPALAISVLESRRADAMQRFKERMMRAGDKTKDIFKAHGWSEPKSELSYEPIFLGSFDGRLDINVVASTTESDDVQLAQLGANGMAVVQGSKVKIKTSDFGVLLVVMHIEKDAVYDSYGVEIAHTLNEPFDYPYPELQNISLAPIDVKYLNLMDKLDSGDIIGYLPRAIGFKTAVDKVHGEFYSSMPYNYNAVRDPNHEASIVVGAFSDWVAPREDLLNFKSKSFLYVSPRCTDTIFKQLSNVRQDSDQFFVNARFDCYAVEPLPVIGLPI